jgi:hypothetical protein
MGHYIGSIRLTGFHEARIIEDDTNDGRRQVGVFIPLDINGLKVHHNMSVYAPLYLMERRLPYKGVTHYFRQRGDKHYTQQLEDLGLELAYLGEMRPYNNKYISKNKVKMDGSTNRVSNFNDNDYE